jgi:hypothetical protein
MKGESNMTIEQLVRRYTLSITINPATNQEALMADLGAIKRDNAKEEIKQKKAEIMAYLKDQRAEDEKRAEEARQREKDRSERIKQIEGLKEIQDAIEDLERWQYEFDKSFDDVGGLGVRPKPDYDIKAMRQKYPRADAYLRAEEEYLKSNYELSAIGKRALEEVIFGDWQKAMETMDKEIKEFVDRHIWD